MKSVSELLASGAVVLGLALAAGCAAGDDVSEQPELDTSRGSTEETATLQESLTSVDMVDCSICAIAKACCTAVSTRSYCDTFNAERCATLDPGRQRTTKLSCLTLLRTTIYAWQSAGRTPPPQCYIPGE